VLQLFTLLGLTLPFFAFKIWRRGDWSLLRRIYYSLMALAGILLMPFFYYWNLLGFQFVGRVYSAVQ
jgi:hypothetical protein